MRFGCTTSEVGRIWPLAEIGYDYVELSARTLAPLDDEHTFASIRERILAAPIRPEALCGFIPPYVGLRVVGPEVDRARLRGYVETVLGRASQIGTKVAVFGSGSSRMVPDGYPRAKALDQLRDFLATSAEMAAALGITLAIEVLNRGETNLVNTMDEALALVRDLGRPNLRTMVDYYHVLTDGQSLQQVQQAGSLLVHAHTSDAGRQPPGTGGSDQAAFLSALRSAGYDGRLSIECRFQDFPREASAALAHLKDVWRSVAGS